MSGLGPRTANAAGQVTIIRYYGYNLQGLGSQDETSVLMNEGVPSEVLRTAGQKVMFADALYDRLHKNGSDNYLDEFTTSFPSGYAETYVTAYRHDGRANVTYYDGHAFATPRDELDMSVLTDPNTVWNLPN